MENEITSMENETTSMDIQASEQNSQVGKGGLPPSIERKHKRAGVNLPNLRGMLHSYTRKSTFLETRQLWSAL